MHPPSHQHIYLLRVDVRKPRYYTFVIIFLYLPYQFESIIHTDGSRGAGFFLPLFACLIFRTVSRDTMQLGSPLDTQVFHGEFWKTIYFQLKRSKVKVTSHKLSRRRSLHSCECWLLLHIVAGRKVPLYFCF